MRRAGRIIALVLVAAILFAAMAQVQRKITLSRTGLLSTDYISARDRLIELGSTVVLGCFRTVATNILWYKAANLKEKREWVELEGVIRLIAKVQPTEMDAYLFQVWNMAYNIQYDAPTVVEGWKWVEKALDFGQTGIERNPNHPELWRLYWQIGWTISHRCASVPDQRTTYFAEQIEKKYGKHPYLIAADWYQKAVQAAKAEQAREPNVRWLSMWPYAYSEYARLLERKGDVAGMLAMREEAIQKHHTLMRLFPEYEELGVPAAQRLETLIALHKKKELAEEFASRNDVENELKVRLELADQWTVIFKGEKFVPEVQRELDHATNALEQLIPKLDDTDERNRLAFKVLEMRYVAADPQMSSEDTVRKLVHAVSQFDPILERLDTPSELVNNQPLVQMAADVWARVIQNPVSDETYAKRTEQAIAKFDKLVKLLPPEEQMPLLPMLAQYWQALISSTELDVPLGKRRLVEIASARDSVMFPLLNEIERALTQFKEQGQSMDRQQRQAVLGLVMSLSLRANELIGEAGLQWGALLKKNPAYANESAIAERQLRLLAESTERIGELAQDLLGRRSQVAPTDPRSFAFRSSMIWQLLHQHDPRNILYLQKARETDTN